MFIAKFYNPHCAKITLNNPHNAISKKKKKKIIIIITHSMCMYFPFIIYFNNIGFRLVKQLLKKRKKEKRKRKGE